MLYYEACVACTTFAMLHHTIHQQAPSPFDHTLTRQCHTRRQHNSGFRSDRSVSDTSSCSPVHCGWIRQRVPPTVISLSQSVSHRRCCLYVIASGFSDIFVCFGAASLCVLVTFFNPLNSDSYTVMKVHTVKTPNDNSSMTYDFISWLLIGTGLITNWTVTNRCQRFEFDCIMFRSLLNESSPYYHGATPLTVVSNCISDCGEMLALPFTFMWLGYYPVTQVWVTSNGNINIDRNNTPSQDNSSTLVPISRSSGDALVSGIAVARESLNTSLGGSVMW